MAKFEPNEAGIEAVMRQAGQRLADMVKAVHAGTQEQPLDQAVATLRRRLASVGAEVNDEWATNALQTLRDGKPLQIDLR